MHKLAIVRSAPMVTELMRRLEAASIDAFNATESTIFELHAGGQLSVGIWIKDEEQVPRSLEIFRQLVAEQTELRCPGCNYDLRGHSDETVCPECGTDVTVATPDRPCPKCSEPVPHGFEVCWNCGVEVPPRV